jgi:thymidylate synthase (FAD)
MSGSIRSWIHYVQIRAGVETQLEHRMIAQDVKEILRKNLPAVYEASFS